MKKLRRMTACLMSVALLLSCLPAAALAEGDSIEDNSVDAVGTEEPTDILTELTDRREANTKVFRLRDGSYLSAEYPQQIHFMENGQWKDFDNTLTEEKSDEGGENELVNRVSDLKVRLSKKSNGKKLVRMEQNGYRLSWYYVNAHKVTARAVSNDENSDDRTVLNKLTSTAVYSDIYPHVDLEYMVLPTGIKENILLQKRTAQTVFEAEYQSNGLIPEQLDEKTIVLKSENGEIVYTLTAPFMQDAVGAYCDAITLELTGIKNDTFRVKTSLDKDWLAAKDRAYPVLVDPALQTAQNISAARSAFVSSANPNKCHLAAGTDDMGSLYVGNIAGFGQTESYMKFTSLPSLGVADKVIDARVYLALNRCENGLTVNVKQLTSDWDPYTVKWNNKPTSSSIIKDYMALTPETDRSKFQAVEITDLVRGWYAGEYPNYGISLSTDKTTPAKAWFFSIYYTGYTAARPIMTVTYRNMSGYEDYWSYTSVDGGRNGTVSVNNYNGNLVFSQPITNDAGGSLMPVNLAVTYNSNGVPTQFADLTAGYSYMGSNMQTNYHIYIREDSRTSANGYKYFLHDGDGTRHWFYFENNSSTGKDEDGLGYTLDLIAANSDSVCKAARYRIKDKDGNRMYFNSLGNLIQITNANNVSSTVQYETVSDYLRIKSVTDGAGRVYSFGYHPSYPHLLYNITDPSGRKTSFEYWSGFLTMVEFNDGKKYSISYANEVPVQFGSVDGTTTIVRYDTSAQKRVTFVGWGKNENELLNSYSFSYKQNETKITDKLSRTNTYQFNDYGQTTGIVSNTDGSAQFFEYEGGNSTSNTANKLLTESKALKTVINYTVNPGFTRDYSNGFWTYAPDSTGSPTVTIDTAKGNFTKNSLKVYKPSGNSQNVMAVQNVQNLPAGTYTLSGYVNTGGATLAGIGSYFGIEIRDPAGTKVTVTKMEPVKQSSTWERRSITFTLPKDHTLTFVMGFDCYGVNSYGTVWFDDIQLERGEGASSCNLVENSSFSRGTEAWTYADDATFGNLSGDMSYLGKYGHLVADSSAKRAIRSDIAVKGQKGDVFAIGGWMRANSAPIKNGTKTNPTPSFGIWVDFIDGNGKSVGSKMNHFNADVRDWQFLSAKVIAPAAYEKLLVYFSYEYNVNAVDVAGMFCYKEEFGQTYDYDKDGNVASVVDITKSDSSFAFKNNQMTKLLNPSGSKYYYSYAYNESDLSEAVSTDGQRYSFTYDDKGNVLSSKIEADKYAVSLEAGKKYSIRNVESGNVIDNGDNKGTVYNWRYRSANGNQIWELVGTNEANVYYLKSLGYGGLYLGVKNGANTDGADLITAASASGDAFKFQIHSNGDGTFRINTKASNYTKCLDGQPNDSKDYGDGSALKQYTKKSDDKSQQWYFSVDITASSGAKQQSYLYSTAEYTANKNFLSAVTDQTGGKTTYTYDQTKGTLSGTTDALGRTTQYTYDPNTNSLLSVSAGGITNRYTYENDRLKSISANGAVSYGFDYDAFGRRTAVRVGSSVLAQTAYDAAGRVSRQTYGNGSYLDYAYDTLDRVTEKKYNGSATNRAVYRYGADGNLAQTVDYSTGTRTQFTYDLADRLVAQKEYTGTGVNGGTLRSSTAYTYANKTNYLTGVQHFSPLGTQTIGYTYGNMAVGEMPDQIYKVSWNGQEKVNYAYDSLGRLSNKKVLTGNGALDTVYTYKDIGGNRTTTLVQSVRNALGTYTYTYDAVGNITGISDGTNTTSYAYDSLNQLVRENDQRAGKTYTYSYQNGNLTARREYAYTTGALGEVLDTKTWSYTDSAWPDLLTDFNGQTITYDGIGNPLTIGSKTLAWSGRQLQSIADGENAYSYRYNTDGQRISKTVNGATTEYFYNGEILAGQKTGNTTLVFMYDNNGDAFGFTYNGASYYYIRNAQNDVVAIADSSRNVVAKYLYDAWGNMVAVTDANGNEIADSAHVANVNPIRYRSYYFDTETGLYYVSSRYYNPEVGRWINADDPEILLEDQDDLLQYNLFAYCFNNPVNMHDPSGYAAANIIGGIVGGVTGAALGILLAKRLGLTGWKRWALISAATVGGAVLGAFLGPYVAKLAKSIGSAAKTAVKTFTKGELCFVAGTQILTENGHIPIEDIETGDYVYAENPETGEKGLKRVEQTFINEINELIYVTVNSEEILTTPGHPFYVVSKGWIGADALEIGDQLIVYGGEQAVVEKVKHELLNEPITVYNFEVEDFHTYYVGKNSILVHNKGCGLNKLADSYIKKALKLDAHAIKREYLGNKAKISLYDLAVNKKTGIIYIIDKAGKIVTDTIYKSK